MKHRNLWISVAILLAFFYIVFNISGLRWISAIVLLFFIPYYLILDKFKIEEDEKIIFSFFIGLGITPTLVYILNLVITSFRISLLVAFLLTIGAAIIFRFSKKS